MIRPTLVHRYLARRFLTAIAGTFVLCSTLIFMIDFVELLRQAGKYGSVPARTLVWMALLRLPAYTEHINGQLEQHERSFEGLRQSVDEVSNALPVYANTAERMVQATRLLLLLVAAIVGLHAGYLMVSVRLGKQFSP